MRVEIVDVGPRDGLQNEEKTLAPKVRAELCDRLASAGVPRVEAASFVNATVLDAAVGGTGGCPFAPQAAKDVGNIATEDLVYMLHGVGHETGIELEALTECAAWLAEKLGKELPGQVYKAGSFQPVAG